MSDPRAELSSLAGSLEELTRRLSSMADTAARGDETLATELFEIERALLAAHRRLAKVVDQGT